MISFGFYIIMKQNLSARKKRNGERLYHFAEVSVVGDAHVEADLVHNIRHTWGILRTRSCSMATSTRVSIGLLVENSSMPEGVHKE